MMVTTLITNQTRKFNVYILSRENKKKKEKKDSLKTISLLRYNLQVFISLYLLLPFTRKKIVVKYKIQLNLS